MTDGHGFGQCSGALWHTAHLTQCVCGCEIQQPLPCWFSVLSSFKLEVPLSSNVLTPSLLQRDSFPKVLSEVGQNCCGSGELLPRGAMKLQKGYFQFPSIHFSFKTSFRYSGAEVPNLSFLKSKCPEHTHSSCRLRHNLPYLKLEWELGDESLSSAKPLRCSKLVCRLDIGWSTGFKPKPAFKYLTRVCWKPIDCERAACIAVWFSPCYTIS